MRYLILALLLTTCAHKHAREYTISFYPPDAEEETDERVYACYRSPSDLRKAKDETRLSCFDYLEFQERLRAAGSAEHPERSL